MSCFIRSAIGIGTLAIGLALSPVAGAAMVLGYQEVGPGTITGAGTVNAFSVPGSDFYGDTFSSPTNTITANPPIPYGFVDDFIIALSANASASSITSTISLADVLSITNLDVRLYSLAGNPTLPVLGTPAGQVIDGTLTSMGGAMVDTLSATLSAGTYVLEVRGSVIGSAGGSYSGSLNVAPVPVPGALPLLASGIGLLVGLRPWRTRPRRGTSQAERVR